MGLNIYFAQNFNEFLDNYLAQYRAEKEGKMGNKYDMFEERMAQRGMLSSDGLAESIARQVLLGKGSETVLIKHALVPSPLGAIHTIVITRTCSRKVAYIDSFGAEIWQRALAKVSSEN